MQKTARSRIDHSTCRRFGMWEGTRSVHALAPGSGGGSPALFSSCATLTSYSYGTASSWVGWLPMTRPLCTCSGSRSHTAQMLNTHGYLHAGMLRLHGLLSGMMLAMQTAVIFAVFRADG